jgi:hypothetical protein
VSVYLAHTNTSGTQNLEGVIYAAAGGAPGALLGTTSQLAFSSTQASGWYDLRFASPVVLAAGKYWIGLLAGGKSGVAGVRYVGVGGSDDYNGNTYSAGPSNPFGSFSTNNQLMSLYATYSTSPAPPPAVPANTAVPTISGVAQSGQMLTGSTGSWTNSPTSYAYKWQRCDSSGSNCAAISGAAASSYTAVTADVGSTLRLAVIATNAGGSSAPASSAQTAVVTSAPSTATFGRMTVGTSFDAGMFSNYKIVHKATLSVAGSVTKLSLYAIPGVNSPTPQVVKAVIYADSGGSPGALVATGNEVTYAGNVNGSGWFGLPFASPVSLTAGTYWLGFITGGTTEGIGYAYDSVAGSRAYNANSYASGPTNPFGSSTLDSEDASIYATYTPS